MRNFTSELFQLLIDAEKEMSETEYLDFLDTLRHVGANFQVVLLGLDKFRNREIKKREEERIRMKAAISSLSSRNGDDDHEETHQAKECAGSSGSPSPLNPDARVKI